MRTETKMVPQLWNGGNKATRFLSVSALSNKVSFQLDRTYQIISLSLIHRKTFVMHIFIVDFTSLSHRDYE